MPLSATMLWSSVARLARERDAPGQHLVGHDRESVEVARSVRHAPAQLFGGHVGRSADDLAGAGEGGKAEPRDSEVGELGGTSPRQ
jgi:hypothetical protein